VDNASETTSIIYLWHMARACLVKHHDCIKQQQQQQQKQQQQQQQQQQWYPCHNYDRSFLMERRGLI
jgi:hypothetical protein